MSVFYEFSKKIQNSFPTKHQQTVAFYVPSKYTNTKISVRKVATELDNINVSR